jgi:hypothetical protein
MASTNTKLFDPDFNPNPLHPDDRMFGVLPSIICVGCGCQLEHSANPLPGLFIRKHPKWDCVYSEYKFRFHALPIVGTLLRSE